MLRDVLNANRMSACMKMIPLLAGALHVSIALGQTSAPEPGALYPWSPLSVAFVVQDAQSSEPRRIRFLLSSNSAVERRRDREITRPSKTMLDFDTGQPAKTSCTEQEKIPETVPREGQLRDVQASEKNNNVTCHYSDLRQETPTTIVDGTQISIGRQKIELNYFGKPIELDEFLPFFDARAQGWTFTGFVAHTAEGRILWEKIYLIQTDGTYKGPKDTEQLGSSNVVESIQRVGQILFGDKYFYLLNRTGHDFKFGNLIMRVDAITGIPLTRNPRIRAIDVGDFQRLLESIGSELEQHYPKERTLSGGSPKFESLQSNVETTYKWSKNYLDDVPALINFRIQERWFREFIK